MAALLSGCLLLLSCTSSPSPVQTSGPSAGPTLPHSASPSSDPAYLGERQPNTAPVRFAARYVNGPLHTPPNFMPDGKEMYWSTQEPEILLMRLTNGAWTSPEPVSFSPSMADYRDPSIAPGGQRIYFLSTDVPHGSGLSRKENIWTVDRTAGGWSDPVPLPAVVNDLPTHWQVSVAQNGDLYMTSGVGEDMDDIYVARGSSGSFTAPEALPAPINTEAIETTPFIDPAGRYLVFARMSSTSSTPRLHVSWRGADGSWGEPILIAPIAYGLCPVVSPDGRFLFFLSSPRSVGWVSIEVVDRLAPA